MTQQSNRSVVITPNAPEAVGAYSQGVVVAGSRTLYTSGQIALDPATGEMVSDDVEAQARRVLENLGAVLGAADMDWSHVVRATLYLTSMADFRTVNQVYAERFPAAPPARACVEVAALPRGARVEIDLVAVAP